VWFKKVVNVFFVNIYTIPMPLILEMIMFLTRLILQI